MIKVYIAAPWADRDQMPEMARKCEEAGLELTHKWWEIEDLEEVERDESLLRKQAEMDYDGVVDADVMILINSKKSEGKAVEQGIALASCIPIVAVGTLGEFSKNVFHFLDDYHWVKTLDEAIKIVQELQGIL